MKRLFVLVLVMAFVIGFSGLASADCDCDVYDMWKGKFIFTNEFTYGDYPDGVNADYPNIRGQVIFNYVKGQENFMLNIQASGLKPNKEYVLLFQIGGWGTAVERVEIAYVEAASNGRIRFQGTIDLCPNFLTGKTLRVQIRENYTGKIVSDTYGYWIANTAESDQISDFETIGSNRVKCDHCED